MEFFRRISDRIKLIINSKQFARFAPLVLVALVALTAFVTCVPWHKQDPDPEPDPEYDGPVNPLTGLPTEDDISNTRPLSIMINNHRGSLPQQGISKADIIYEVMAEGGITRMLALFQDVSDVGIIGSIRSSRTYYVDIAQSYDSIYLYAGGSNQALSALSNRNITRLDGLSGANSKIFYRDRERSRTMKFEHTLVATGERIAENLPSYNYRFEHAEGYERALSFVDDGAPEGGDAAVGFDVKFGGSTKTTSFEYNDEDNLYYLSQYNSKYIDGNDNSQISVTNVLILRTSVSGIPGDTAGRLDIKTTGRGSGYFVCGGKYVEIEWSRADLASQFIYTLKDGSELNFGRGKTYICIVSNSADIVIN